MKIWQVSEHDIADPEEAAECPNACFLSREGAVGFVEECAQDEAKRWKDDEDIDTELGWDKHEAELIDLEFGNVVVRWVLHEVEVRP